MKIRITQPFIYEHVINDSPVTTVYFPGEVVGEIDDKTAAQLIKDDKAIAWEEAPKPKGKVKDGNG